MADWEAKIQVMAEQVLNSNITNIGGVPTRTLVLINKLFELSGSTDRNLLEIWPDLEVFFHGGVSFAPYRPQFGQDSRNSAWVESGPCAAEHPGGHRHTCPSPTIARSALQPLDVVLAVPSDAGPIHPWYGQLGELAAVVPRAARGLAMRCGSCQT